MTRKSQRIENSQKRHRSPTPTAVAVSEEEWGWMKQQVAAAQSLIQQVEQLKTTISALEKKIEVLSEKSPTPNNVSAASEKKTAAAKNNKSQIKRTYAEVLRNMGDEQRAIYQENIAIKLDRKKNIAVHTAEKTAHDLEMEQKKAKEALSAELQTIRLVGVNKISKKKFLDNMWRLGMDTKHIFYFYYVGKNIAEMLVDNKHLEKLTRFLCSQKITWKLVHYKAPKTQLDEKTVMLQKDRLLLNVRKCRQKSTAANVITEGKKAASAAFFQGIYKKLFANSSFDEDFARFTAHLNQVKISLKASSKKSLAKEDKESVHRAQWLKALTEPLPPDEDAF